MTLNEARASFEVQGLTDDAFDDYIEGQEQAFQNCLAFLTGLRKSKRVCRLRGSYALKHAVERVFPNVPVYEGTCVLAAVALGFKPVYRTANGVRCYFNMYAKELRLRERSLAAR